MFISIVVPVGEIGGRFDVVADPVRGVEAAVFPRARVALGHALFSEAVLRPRYAPPK